MLLLCAALLSVCIVLSQQMSFFKKLASIFSQNQRGGGLSQRTIDNYRASLLLSSFAASRESGHREQPTQDQVNAIFKLVQSWSFEELSTFSQDEINKQVIDLLVTIDKYTTSGSKESSIAHHLGFELERRESSIPAAGQGVFLSIPPSAPARSLPAGSVIALFPGQVHLAEFTQQKDHIKNHLLPDPDMHCLVRVDEPIIIDGRTAHLCPPNPLALAHLVNHCGKTKPNVLQHPYNFPVDPLELDERQSFPKALRKYIPNAYFRKPTMLGTPDRSALMHGAVLLAARPIDDGEELLMDYRLSPQNTLPQWYQHHDEGQAEQRWK